MYPGCHFHTSSELEVNVGPVVVQVHLENRSRVFYFEGEDDTIQVNGGGGRQPLKDRNDAMQSRPQQTDALKASEGREVSVVQDLETSVLLFLLF